MAERKLKLFRCNTKDYIAETFDWIEFVKKRYIELETEIKVLDHGYVRYINHMGSEEDIIRAARMSTQKGFLGWGDKHVCGNIGEFYPDGVIGSVKENTCLACLSKQGDEKLLEYLYKNKHMTPFEMLELCIEVKAPIFVFREWHRHRTQSYNEMSARYIQMPDEHYVPAVRMQDTKNKQGSTNLIPDDFLEVDFNKATREDQKQVYEAYEEFIARGVAKEVARINTPVSRYSVMWAKTDLRNWLAFLQLRMAPNAQLEIRMYANAVASIIKELWPRTYALFEEYTLHSYNLSRADIRLLVDNLLLNIEPSEDDLNRLHELHSKLEVIHNG